MINIPKKTICASFVTLMLLILLPFSAEAVDHRPVLIILPVNGFNDDAYFETVKLFEKNRMDVVTVSVMLRTNTGVKGGKVRPDIGFELIDPEQYDAVILIGGREAFPQNNPEVDRICKEMLKKRRPVAAEGFAVMTLAQAGLLNDMRVAGTPEIKKYLEKAGAIYTTFPLYRDELIVTAAADISPPNLLAEEVRLMLHPFADKWKKSGRAIKKTLPKKTSDNATHKE